MPPNTQTQTRYDITVFETGGSVDGSPCYGACFTGAAQGDNVILAAKTHAEAIASLLSFDVQRDDRNAEDKEPQ